MTKACLAAIVLAALPSLASATCMGERHEEVTMSCTGGTVWDADTSRCVPTTG